MTRAVVVPPRRLHSKSASSTDLQRFDGSLRNTRAHPSCAQATSTLSGATGSSPNRAAVSVAGSIIHICTVVNGAAPPVDRGTSTQSSSRRITFTAAEVA